MSSASCAPEARALPFAARAWLVDLDGTLYRAAGVKLCMAAELVTSRHARRVVRVFRAEHERVRCSVVGPDGDPYRRQMEQAARRLRLSVEEVESVVLDWMFRRPAKWIRLFRRQALLDAIERFRGAGGLTALVSDYPASLKLAALGSQHAFDVVVAAGETGGPGRLKPCPDGYLIAAEQLGMLAEDCLVIGDSVRHDGIAALRAGMQFRHVSQLRPLLRRRT